MQLEVRVHLSHVNQYNRDDGAHNDADRKHCERDLSLASVNGVTGHDLSMTERQILFDAASPAASCRCLMLCPILRPLAALSRRTGDWDEFGHFPAHFSLDDFSQGNVRHAEIGHVGDERPAGASSAS